MSELKPNNALIGFRLSVGGNDGIEEGAFSKFFTTPFAPFTKGDLVAALQRYVILHSLQLLCRRGTGKR